MKVVGQSTTSTKLPYFHLAYLAANNSVSRMQGGFVVSGGVILILGFIIFSKWVKEGYNSVYNVMPSLSFKRRLAIGTFLLVTGAMLFLHGISTRNVQYYASHCIRDMGDLFKQHASANDGQLPDVEKWCDALVTNKQYEQFYFDFDGGDILERESGFAINGNVAGKVLSDLPGDVVLLFETDLGHNESERSEKRWNQCGGREILTTRYNDGEGCDVLFADGRAEFVPNAELDSLRWEVD